VDGKGVGSGAGEQDVLGFVHNGAGERDGVARVLDIGDGPGLHGGSVHDGGVHLVGAVGGEDGSAPGVEEGIVLHNFNGCFDGIDGGAAFVEHDSGGGDGLAESIAILPLDLRRHGGALDHAGSAVKDDG